MVSLVSELLVTTAHPYVAATELLDNMTDIVRGRAALVRDRREGLASWTSEHLAAEALVAARTRGSEPDTVPVARLSASFSLTATEQRVLWTLVAHELSPAVRELVRAINTEQTADATTDAVLRIAYGDAAHGPTAWREMSPDGTLQLFGLIERTDGQEACPRHRQTWKVSSRVLSLVHGEIQLDPALFRIAAIRAPEAVALALSPGVEEQLAAACNGDGVVIVHGGAATGRRSALLVEMARRGKRVLEIQGRGLAKECEAARRELRMLAREAALLGLTPVIRDLDALGASGEIDDRIGLVETEMRGLVLGTASRVVARRWRRTASQIELRPLTGEQRARLWQVALPTVSADRADELATLYPLAPGLIHTTGALLGARSFGREPTAEQLGNALRSILDDRLLGLATRVSVTQTWDDMVLPEDQLASIVELMSRIRERRTVYERWGFADKLGKGLGVSALFSGPPGTGKTMSAGLIARDLGVEMYQVDLSKIVSKWIGETEKNLAAVFDAAEAGHAILLFDEADALFGRRTEVNSSNDRYANQEVNFLLQRLESYAGIVILTTNHETAIDEAFRRRLSVRVQFPMPEAEERAKLWRALLPKNAPTLGLLGLDRLAEHYVMSGGYIRNAVVRAAFLAAAEGTPITAAHLSKSAQLEYEAMGKVAPRL